MSVSVTRTRQVWDHCVMTKLRVVADDADEAINALRLIEEYDAAVIAGDEYAAIVERLQK